MGPFRGKADGTSLTDLEDVENLSIPAYRGGLIDPLGSGSDYTVFLQRLGVRTLMECVFLYGS